MTTTLQNKVKMVKKDIWGLKLYSAYLPTIIISASLQRGLINFQISTVKMVDEELKTEVKLETSEAIMTESMRPRAPDGRSSSTNEGNAVSVQLLLLPQTFIHMLGSPHTTVSTWKFINKSLKVRDLTREEDSSCHSRDDHKPKR